jgi:hypothetical protein
VARHVANPGSGNQQNKNRQKIAHRSPPFKTARFLAIYRAIVSH